MNASRKVFSWFHVPFRELRLVNLEVTIIDLLKSRRPFFFLYQVVHEILSLRSNLLLEADVLLYYESELFSPS